MKTIILRSALVAGAALAVAGCADDYYRHRGYAGFEVGYASPYYGWYDDYYYPGVGVYLYDRSGGRQRWSDSQRSYWEARRPRSRTTENWSGYGRERPRHYR